MSEQYAGINSFRKSMKGKKALKGGGNKLGAAALNKKANTGVDKVKAKIAAKKKSDAMAKKFNITF
jgi:hypothetical protein